VIIGERANLRRHLSSPTARCISAPRSIASSLSTPKPAAKSGVSIRRSNCTRNIPKVSSIAASQCGSILRKRRAILATGGSLATIDARLFALDATSGQLCEDFGAAGKIDLTHGIANITRRGEYEETSAPATAGDLVFVGSSIADNDRVDSPSGQVRAFDPERQIFVTNANIFAIEVHLIPCDRYQEFEKAAKEGRFRAEVSPPFRHV
jgi:hypothetical protein